MTRAETIDPSREATNANKLNLKKPRSTANIILGMMTRFAVYAAVMCIKVFTQFQSTNHDPTNSRSVSDDLTLTILEHGIDCGCDLCIMELTVISLRMEYLFANDPTAAGFRRWVAIMQPFTSIETALLETNNERFVELCFPVLAWLIEKEIDAWYNREF